MKVLGIGRPMRWFLVGMAVLLAWGAVAGYIGLREFHAATSPERKPRPWSAADCKDLVARWPSEDQQTYPRYVALADCLDMVEGNSERIVRRHDALKLRRLTAEDCNAVAAIFREQDRDRVLADCVATTKGAVR